MVVAVLVTRMMQMTLDDVVHVITVGDGRVRARWSVRVIDDMSAARMVWRADRRIGFVYANEVWLDSPVVDVIHSSTIDVISMIFVLDRSVAATLAMGVRLTLRHLVVAHFSSPG
jgi:hypothetical protein